MKEKLVNFIRGINLSLIAFLCYIIKITAFSANYADCLVLAVLAGTYCYTRHIKLKEPRRFDRSKDEMAKLSSDVKELKGALAKVSISKIGQAKTYF